MLLLLLIGFSGATFAQEATSTDNTKEMTVTGDIAKGMFRLTYRLPQDAKNVVWTVTHEDGTLTVKEKYKKKEAGTQNIDYNFKSAPAGMYTFQITADDVVIATKEVMKSY